jgi:hypothetical protein
MSKRSNRFMYTKDDNLEFTSAKDLGKLGVKPIPGQDDEVTSDPEQACAELHEVCSAAVGMASALAANSALPEKAKAAIAQASDLLTQAIAAIGKAKVATTGNN